MLNEDERPGEAREAERSERDEEKTRIDYKHFLAKYDPEVKIVRQLELYQEKLHSTKGIKKTMSIGSFCGYPTPR